MSANLRTPLSRAVGLGSAKEGVAHWWHQRVSAIALAPLTIWFIWVLFQTIGQDYATVREYLRQPWTATLMISYLVCLFYHGRLGLQVVIEDYVHQRGIETTLQILVKFAAFLIGAASVIAMLRIAVGG